MNAEKIVEKIFNKNNSLKTLQLLIKTRHPFGEALEVLNSPLMWYNVISIRLHLSKVLNLSLIKQLKMNENSFL